MCTEILSVQTTVVNTKALHIRPMFIYIYLMALMVLTDLLTLYLYNNIVNLMYY